VRPGFRWLTRPAQLLEAAELVKQIETTFGVDASAPVGGGGMVMMAGGAAAPAEAEEAQTEFNLIIVDCAADKRIAAIKVVRSMTTLGLKEAKDAVTALPFTILEAKPKADVDKAKAELEAAGCKAREIASPGGWAES
jgi:large subunit ribosomal protein L7/L12